MERLTRAEMALQMLQAREGPVAVFARQRLAMLHSALLPDLPWRFSFRLHGLHVPRKSSMARSIIGGSGERRAVGLDEGGQGSCLAAAEGHVGPASPACSKQQQQSLIVHHSNRLQADCPGKGRRRSGHLFETPQNAGNQAASVPLPYPPSAVTFSTLKITTRIVAATIKCYE